ncbi:hypothetical protein PNH50_12425 [Leisingera aquaemixtae]|uniref:hypothetical protein n=1 Tax=Leisingera aquaemixtae TaxID=1396826 RepID=UPI0039842AEF
MADTDKALEELEDLFAAARSARPGMPAHLNTAILADAARAQAGFSAARPARAVRQPKWRQLVEAIGGWPAMGGLAAASAAGLWIGMAPPSFVPDPVVLAGYEESGSVFADDSYDMALMLSEDLR